MGNEEDEEAGLRRLERGFNLQNHEVTRGEESPLLTDDVDSLKREKTLLYSYRYCEF